MPLLTTMWYMIPVSKNEPFKTNETMPDFRNGDAVHKFQDYRRLHYPYLLLLKITESL